MPCNSDYLEPTHREREFQRAATLLLYVRKKTGKPAEAWAKKEAYNIYARDERCVTVLCIALGVLSQKEMEEIVYNAHDARSRDLANWREEHLEADQKRDSREAAARENERLRKEAMAKLSPAEQRAILAPR